MLKYYKNKLENNKIKIEGYFHTSNANMFVRDISDKY